MSTCMSEIIYYHMFTIKYCRSLLIFIFVQLYHLTEIKSSNLLVKFNLKYNHQINKLFEYKFQKKYFLKITFLNKRKFLKLRFKHFFLSLARCQNDFK